MSRFARLAVLVTALASLLTALSSTAGAVTFTNSGSTAFTATGGPFTISVGSNNLACPSSSATGMVASGAFTAIHKAWTWSNCSLVGIHVHASCTVTTTPIAFHASVFPPSFTITGPLDVSCTVALGTSPNTALCTISGQTPGSYTNPSGTTKGRFTLTASSSLIVRNATDASCSAFGVPTGQSRNGNLTEQTINITNGTPTTLGPVVTSP